MFGNVDELLIYGPYYKVENDGNFSAAYVNMIGLLA